MYFRKNIKLRVLLKATKGMLKLILIFKKCIKTASISSAENSFSSVETTYLFFEYYPVENRLEQKFIFQKRSYV